MINKCKLCNKVYKNFDEYSKDYPHDWDEVTAIVAPGNQPRLYVPCPDSYYSGYVTDINFCPQCGRQINPNYKVQR